MNTTVAKMGRSRSILKHCSAFLTILLRQVVQALEPRTDYQRHAIQHRAITLLISIPHKVTDASSRIRFSETCKNTPYGTTGTVKRHTQRYRHMQMCTL
jgi:hypothetical protein